MRTWNGAEKVNNHLKGAHKDMCAVLEKIEGRRTEILQHNLDRNFDLMIDLDCNQLSAAVFHMLYQLLSGKAQKELSDHDSVQGLEVWRTIATKLTDKGPTKGQHCLTK